jgi:DNA modification methylase
MLMLGGVGPAVHRRLAAISATYESRLFKVSMEPNQECTRSSSCQNADSIDRLSVERAIVESDVAFASAASAAAGGGAISPARWHLIRGDAFEVLPRLPSCCINTTVTSPPYFRQKHYGSERQLGWEPRVKEYIDKLACVFAELFRLTQDDGVCFVIIGDSYADRSLQLVPQRAAIAAADCGWTLRNDLVWAKTDAAPGSGADRWRFTHEHILFLTKRPRGYKFHADTLRVPYSDRTVRRWGNGQTYGGVKARSKADARGQRFARGKAFRLNPAGTLPPDVLSHPTARSHLLHYATFPIELIERFVLATTHAGDVVFDPFSGTSTTGVAAIRHRRTYLGVELSASYRRMAARRLEDESRKVCESLAVPQTGSNEAV